MVAKVQEDSNPGLRGVWETEFRANFKVFLANRVRPLFLSSDELHDSGVSATVTKNKINRTLRTSLKQN